MTLTALTVPTHSALTADDVIALAFQYEAASLISREAWRAYCCYADASPEGCDDATTAALYAAHIAADDVASTRYMALLDALKIHTRGDFATLVGTHGGRAVLVEWSRALHLAYVHVSEVES